MKKTIKIVTTNRNKFIDMKKKLADFVNVGHLNVEIPEIRDMDVRNVCKEKLKRANLITKEKNIIVEDRGFYIHELNGFPGSNVKLILSTIGVKKLVKLIEKDRSCYFKFVLGYMDDRGTIHLFESVEKGYVSLNERCGNDRGWGPLMNIFISPLYPGKTLSELDDGEWLEYKKQFEGNNYLSKFVRFLSRKP